MRRNIHICLVIVGPSHSWWDKKGWGFSWVKQQPCWCGWRCSGQRAGRPLSCSTLLVVWHFANVPQLWHKIIHIISEVIPTNITWRITHYTKHRHSNLGLHNKLLINNPMVHINQANVITATGYNHQVMWKEWQDYWRNNQTYNERGRNNTSQEMWKGGQSMKTSFCELRTVKPYLKQILEDNLFILLHQIFFSKVGTASILFLKPNFIC